MHWHVWHHASITNSNVFFFLCFFAFSGISLSCLGVKCQPAAFGQPQKYSPASKKKMPWYCVSAEFSEDQPDQSGWKWRACGHLLRGWEGEISPLITAGYWSLGLQRRIANHCFPSFIIHPQIHIKVILSAVNLMLMMWNLRCLGVNFLEGTPLTVGALTCSFISTISTHKPIFFSWCANL